MNKNFLHTVAVATCALLSAFWAPGTAGAQSPCKNTNVLNINTGIDASDAKINFVAGAQDPFWTISAQTGSVPAGVTIGGQAYITTNSVMATSASSNLLSYSPTGGDDNGGYITTPADTSFGAFSLTFRRTFRTCQSDDFQFDFDLAFDNYLVSIEIDGIPLSGAVSPSTSAPGYYQWGNLYSTTRSLGAGTHTIDIRIGNEYATYRNPTSLNLRGTVTGTTNSLVANSSPSDCACATTGCSDPCYWKVAGNSILGGNNIFGTLTKDGVRIQTAASNRGTFTADGKLGWNLMSPSTLFHIRCDGRFGEPSDVRIENLPEGHGRILVVDENGYLYRSGQEAKPAPESEALETLRKEVALLRAQVMLLTKEKGTAGSPDAFLYPNPAQNSLEVQLLNAGARKVTAFVITDMQGKTILTLPARQLTDAQTMQVDISSLAPGTYIGTITADDHTSVGKKFTVQR